MDVLYFKDNYNVLSEINNSIRISKLNNLQLGSIPEAAWKPSAVETSWNL